MELTNRRRLVLAGLTVALTAFSVVLVAWGPPALGAHIPDTGPLPSNCVEFQAGTTGPKSPPAYPGVTITLVEWDDEPGDPHEVTFTISGLAAGQYVDASVKSGTNVQEPGPYGNGTHTFNNTLQNAISHIRLCVFVQGTTTTLDETTTTLDETTTTGAGETTTTGAGETTTTAAGETTTTVAGATTTTGAGGTTTTGATPSTVEDEVLGAVVTTSSVVTQSTVAGTQIVAGDLPFTGLNAGNIGQLALALLLLGTLILTAARSVTRTRSQDQG